MALYQGEDIEIKLRGDGLDSVQMYIYPKGKENEGLPVVTPTFESADNSYTHTIEADKTKTMQGSYTIEVIGEKDGLTRIYRQENAFYVEHAAISEQITISNQTTTSEE